MLGNRTENHIPKPTRNKQPATPEMAEIFDFFAISRMLEKHWHQSMADCLFFGTGTICPPGKSLIRRTKILIKPG